VRHVESLAAGAAFVTEATQIHGKQGALINRSTFGTFRLPDQLVDHWPQGNLPHERFTQELFLIKYNDERFQNGRLVAIENYVP
jgi:hypothetical protein